MLKTLKKNGKYSANINTFGFGYSLDSELLNQISQEGNGSFSFIPDGSMVGTILINSLSNITTTFSENIKLKIDLEDIRIKNTDHLKHFKYELNQKSIEIDVGPLLISGKRDIVLPIEYLNSQKSIKMDVSYENPWSPFKSYTQDFNIEKNSNFENEILMEEFRLKAVNKIYEAMKSFERHPDISKNTISSIIEEIGLNTNLKKEPFIIDLLKDLEFEIMLSFNEENFRTWGRHYLLSIARAHLTQQCNNFKDPGVQHYGGELFSKRRDYIEEKFLLLPPPKPTAISRRTSTTNIQSMSSFYNSNNPCFDGDCLVAMYDYL
jgi:hypothetical protein